MDSNATPLPGPASPSAGPASVAIRAKASRTSTAAGFENSANEQAPAAKRPRAPGVLPTRTARDVFVGHHVDDDRVIIYARHDSIAGVTVRAFKEELTDDIPLKQRISTRGGLKYEEVALDATIFSKHLLIGESLSSIEKKRLVTEYVESRRRDVLMSDDITQNSRASSIHSDTHVGFLKKPKGIQRDIGPRVPVYAYLTTHNPPMLLYRTHKDEADLSMIDLRHKTKTSFEDIGFLNDLGKGNRTLTKKHIKGLLMPSPKFGYGMSPS